MQIGFALYSGALITGATLVADMLAAASRLRPRKMQRQQPYQACWYAQTLEQQATSSGLLVLPHFTYADRRPLDLIVLPALWGNPRKSICQQPELLSWLQHHHQQQTPIVATGTGMVWLAEAKLLDGQVATTHWHYYDALIQNYPSIHVNQHASITQANQLYCAASLKALSELLLYLIKQWYGAATAHLIEKHFHHEVATDHQPCFETGGSLQFDEAIALAQDFMQRHFAEPITMQAVAKAAGISLRTLSRKFKAQVGEAPAEHLQKIRLNTAKKLLADWSMNIHDIAEQVGYQDPYYFAKQFEKNFSITPSAYKRMVKAKVYRSKAQATVDTI